MSVNKLLTLSTATKWSQQSKTIETTMDHRMEAKQVQIQDWVKGGPSFWGRRSFWVFNAQIFILTHSRDSFSLIFDIYFDTKSW